MCISEIERAISTNFSALRGKLELVFSYEPVWIGWPGDGSQTISAEMRRVSVKGFHRIEVRDRNGELLEATLDSNGNAFRSFRPLAKTSNILTTLTVIYAQERTSPEGRERIDWKLITDLSVRSRKDALRLLNWYALRWKIETFHKILKSGCKAEESKLRTAERLVNLISSFCILAWRIFWMTMINRSYLNCPPPPLSLTLKSNCSID